MLVNSLIQTLIHLGATLPTGRKDPQAYEKYGPELRELTAEKHRSTAQFLEAGDCAYYLVKAWDNGIIRREHLEDQLIFLGILMREPVEIILMIAIVKYGLRSRDGNPKNHEEEIKAVEEFLANKGEK